MVPKESSAVKKDSVARLNFAQHSGVAQTDASDISKDSPSTDLLKELRVSTSSKADVAPHSVNSSFAVVTSPTSEFPGTRGAFSATFPVALGTAPETVPSASLLSFLVSKEVEGREPKSSSHLKAAKGWNDCEHSQQKNCSKDSPFSKSFLMERSQSVDADPADLTHRLNSTLLGRSKTSDPDTPTSARSHFSHLESPSSKFAFPTLQQAQLKIIGMANSAFSPPPTPLKARPTIAGAITPLVNHFIDQTQDHNSNSTAFVRSSGITSQNVQSELQASDSPFPHYKQTQIPKDSETPDVFSDAVEISNFTPECESQKSYFPDQSQESNSEPLSFASTSSKEVKPAKSQLPSATSPMQPAAPTVDSIASADPSQFSSPFAFPLMHALHPGQTPMAFAMPITPAQGQVSPFGATSDSRFVSGAAPFTASPSSHISASPVHSIFCAGNDNSPFTIINPSPLGSSNSMASGTFGAPPSASYINNQLSASRTTLLAGSKASSFSSRNALNLRLINAQTSKGAKVTAKISEAKAHTMLQKRLESVVAALEHHERNVRTGKNAEREPIVDLPTNLPIGISNSEGGMDIGIFYYAHAWDRLPYEPDPTRTLVLVNLPAEQRTSKFISDWYGPFGFPSPTHVEVDPENSKALVEFATIKQAVRAFMGPIIEGESGPFEDIRAAWFDDRKRISLDELKCLSASC